MLIRLPSGVGRADRRCVVQHLRVAIVAVAFTTAVAGCATDGSPSDVVAALCAVRDADGVEATEDAFYGRVHTELHTLADDVVEVDPSVGARLLEAKNQVETGLDQGLAEPQLEERLGVLIAQAHTASEVVERPVSDC